MRKELAVADNESRTGIVTKIRAFQAAIARGMKCQRCGQRATRMVGSSADLRASCAQCAAATAIDRKWAATLRRRRQFGTY